MNIEHRTNAYNYIQTTRAPVSTDSALYPLYRLFLFIFFLFFFELALPQQQQHVLKLISSSLLSMAPIDIYTSFFLYLFHLIYKKKKKRTEREICSRALSKSINDAIQGMKRGEDVEERSRSHLWAAEPYGTWRHNIATVFSLAFVTSSSSASC